MYACVCMDKITKRKLTDHTSRSFDYDNIRSRRACSHPTTNSINIIKNKVERDICSLVKTRSLTSSASELNWSCRFLFIIVIYLLSSRSSKSPFQFPDMSSRVVCLARSTGQVRWTWKTNSLLAVRNIVVLVFSAILMNVSLDNVYHRSNENSEPNDRHDASLHHPVRIHRFFLSLFMLR